MDSLRRGELELGPYGRCLIELGVGVSITVEAAVDVPLSSGVCPKRSTNSAQGSLTPGLSMMAGSPPPPCGSTYPMAPPTGRPLTPPSSARWVFLRSSAAAPAGPNQERMPYRAGCDEVEKQVGQPRTNRLGLVGRCDRWDGPDCDLHLGPNGDWRSSLSCQERVNDAVDGPDKEVVGLGSYQPTLSPPPFPPRNHHLF